uniref:Uncharacterized protein n=1 Tax=Anguilla anguilla TaxID=7936 RepID=A0A0E9V7C5_ANGAN
MIHKHTMLVNMANSTYIKQHLFSLAKIYSTNNLQSAFRIRGVTVLG